MSAGGASRGWRGALLAGLAAVAIAAPCGAEPGSFIGAWGRSYARYLPSLFGPEKPLREILESLDVRTDDRGKLTGARVLVIKARRRLELWVGERMVKAYRIQLSQRSRGQKEHRSDQRTPEGDYAICAHRPSKYSRGLWLNYPNLDDAERALARGRISREQRQRIEEAIRDGECPPQNTRLGGFVILHGQQKSLTASLRRAQRRGRATVRRGLQPGDADPATMREYFDWTSGCIAMFNPDIRELYELLPDGTPVAIVADAPATRPMAMPE